MQDSSPVYFDNAASTRMDEKVLDAMKPYFFEKYAVATSEFAYSQGIEVSEALGEARAVLSGACPGFPASMISCGLSRKTSTQTIFWITRISACTAWMIRAGGLFSLNCHPASISRRPHFIIWRSISRPCV